MSGNGKNTESRMAIVQESQAIQVAQADTFKLALEPNSFEGALRAASVVAKAGVCGVKTAEEALIRMATGRELGLGFMQSMRLIFVVNGRPGLDASLMLALCLQSPICEKFECTETTGTSATFVAKRRGQSEKRLTWTIEQAKQAKLTDKDNWKNYPDAMNRARCIAALARLVFPDVVAGLYTRDELEDGVIETRGETVNEMTGEVVTSATPRDYDAEKAAAIAAIHDVAALRDKAKETNDPTDAETYKSAFTSLRTAMQKSEIPSPWMDEIRAAYNAAFSPKKAAA